MEIIAVLIIACFYQSHGLKIDENNNDAANLTDVIEYVLLDKSNNPCARKCVEGALPMTCRYHFVLEYYTTLSKACYNCPLVQEDCFRPDCIPGDGRKRPVLVVNRQIPGPSIEVCLGDEVIIDVENQLGSESSTIHWHGHHQRYSPYMDGVPLVTQCPIHAGSTFRYQFRVTNAGSHFWHSHSGFQRADGAFGPFIVRRPEESDYHSNLYDYDMSAHVITLLDWGQELGLDKFVAHHHNDGDNKPSTILINGHGRFKVFESENNETLTTPVAKFTVEQGFRYRFRLINAGFLNCPVEVSIDNHTLTAISSDGSDFEAVEAESIVLYAGERFDFILKANQPKDTYWMRFSGLMDCDERFKKAHQVAMLDYENSELDPDYSDVDYEHSRKPGKQINSLNKGTEAGTMHVSLPELKSLDPWDKSLQEIPDFKYYVSYDFYKIDNPHFHKWPLYGFNNVTNTKQQLLTPQLNHISMKLLPFPLLSQRSQIEQSMLCNETNVQDCVSTYCECTHVVNIPLNAVVEMILIDKGFAFDANHPFHLHGHSFRVVAMERMGKNVTLAEIVHKDEKGLIQRNLEDAPIKDTVTVPDGGYTVIRFQASNPGYWLFHCHIEFHVEVGMALVFKIGDDDQMPPVPQDFPKCGNYLPAMSEDKTGSGCANSTIFGNIIKDLLPGVYDKDCSSSSISRLNEKLLILVLFVNSLYIML